MTPEPALLVSWRAPFANREINELHAEAFEHRVLDDDELDWAAQTEHHSLGWVVARDGDRCVGFANVISDGDMHPWIQDVMTAASHRRTGVGVDVVRVAADGARDAGCTFLHVDFDEQHRPFYIDACGFTPAAAGLLDLTPDDSP